MHEALVARIDADVTDAAAVQPEEHEIARPQLATIHGPRGCVLLRRRPRHVDAHLVMCVGNEAAAVECIGTRTPVAVWRPDAGFRGIQESATRVDQRSRRRRRHLALERRAGGHERQ